jgi:lysozyme
MRLPLVNFANPVIGHIRPLGSGAIAGNWRGTVGYGVIDSLHATPHGGIDIGNLRCGDPIVAAAAGEVVTAGIPSWGGGAKIVRIVHHTPAGQRAWRTFYGHLATISVHVGQQVAVGTVLGTCGSTGRATACHLHFETQEQNATGTAWLRRDPWPLLTQNIPVVTPPATEAVETRFGVDVSQWQGAIDWTKVAASGITFMVARCVREGGTVDATYAGNVARAKAAGLTTGAYAFLAGGGVAGQQAATFIAAVGDPTGMLIALDIERPSSHPTPSAWAISTFVAAWRAAWPNHPLLLYGSRGGTLGTIGAGTTLASSGSLWLANYGTNPAGVPVDVYAVRGGDASPLWHSTFSGWSRAMLWQFSSRGTVAGVAGRVDLDAFRGTPAEFGMLAGV